MKTNLAISQQSNVVSVTVPKARKVLQVWFSAGEIADLAKRSGLKSLPQSRSGIVNMIEQNDWDSVPDLVRKRRGKGGGNEYHISLLADDLQSYVQGQVLKDIEVADRQSHQALEERRQKDLATTDLTGRQRQVMEARAAILGVVDQLQNELGLSRRQAVIRFLKTIHSEHQMADTISVGNDRAKRTCSVSKATLYNWYKLRDEIGIAALAPKLTRKPSDLPEWFDGFLAFYARPQKPAAARALRKYAKSLPDPSKAPNYDQVQRALKKLDMSIESGGTIARHRGREGRLALKARMAYVTRSTAGMLPTYVYTADGQTFDAEVAHPIHGQAFRPEITSILDVATRKCVGFSVGLSENTIVVMDALRIACEAHGIPAIFYVDRGPGYKNNAVDNEVTGFAARLGITKMHALPRNAQAKGMIERFNGTVLVPLAKEFPTYIGADMDREAGQKVHKITRKEIREFGISKTLPSFADFMQAMRDEIDDYNNRPHSGIDGSTPNEAWNAHVIDGFEPVEVTQAESDDLFRPYVRRKTNRAQLNFLKNDYFHIDLEAYHGREVLVGYDIHDGQHVWVREISADKNGDEVPGRLICIAKFAGNTERYIPQSYQNAANEKRHKQRKNRLEKHMQEVDLELSPIMQIEQNSAPEFTMATGPELVIDNVETEPVKPVQASTKLRFSSDEDLALWALENPTELSSNQVRVLRDCLISKTALDLLKMSGVDTERLRTVLRAFA